MSKKMSKATKLKISNARHWNLAWLHNQVYLNETHFQVKDKERVKFHYHNAVRVKQIDCGRILSKIEKRAIYRDVQRELKDDVLTIKDII